MAKVRDQGIAGESIILFMHVRDRDNMNLIDPYSVADVLIYGADPKDRLIAADPILTLTPNKLCAGTFFVQFEIPSNWCSGRYYDKWAVVVEKDQAPAEQVQTFLVQPKAVILTPESAPLPQDSSPRVTLLTKEIFPGETRQIRFVLSKPQGLRMPPVEVRIFQDGQPITDWLEAVREDNQGYLMFRVPEEASPGILRLQFRLKLGDQTLLTPLNDLRLLAP